MPRRVGVVGHQGYSGAELIRILKTHREVEAVLLDHRESPDSPRYLNNAPIERTSASAEAAAGAGLELVFLATPPEASLELVPGMLDAGIRVVDLSGAFRLRTSDNYSRWYGGEHPALSLLAQAVYGLPEFYRDCVRNARFVSNPGCYPTAANLAIAPLIRQDLVERAVGIICDAKSGVSGAGRKPSLKTSFCEVVENFSAYAILEHRHVPEVLMHSLIEEREFSFTAQLLPIDRGILETVYFRARPGVTADILRDTFQQVYASEPFVRLHARGSSPTLHDVAYTNFCDLSFHLDEKSSRGVVVSAIDNLGKGAAGQAIQNMNLMLGFSETEGLL